MGHNRRSLLPLALLLLSQVARCYLPPEGPDLRTARIVDPGEYPGAHADLLAVREMEASNSRRALSPPGQHVDIFNTGLLGFRRTPAVRWRKFARDSAAIL